MSDAFRVRDKFVEERILNKDISPDGKLVLYNYTPKCIYDKRWNKHTKVSRGSVFELATGKLVAMAFPKFFNLSELSASKSRNLMKKQNYECYEKIDGSLGICYFYDGDWHINTRGKFISEQAIEAKKIMEEKYDLSSVDHKLTLLVEIVYPNNKIVVDYEDMRELILLASYNIDTKKEIDRVELEDISKATHMPLVKMYNYTLEEMIELQKDLDDQTEGFVVKFESGERIKIKSIEYLKIVKLINDLTPLGIWRFMKRGKVNKEALYRLPEEFRELIDELVEKMERIYEEMKAECYVDYNSILKSIKDKYGEDVKDIRKKIGLKIDTVKHKNAIFPIHLNEPDNLDEYIMKRIRPTGNDLDSDN